MAPAKKTSDAPKRLELRTLEELVIDVDVVGVTPLIPHRWSEKAKRMMAEKQATGMRGKKEPKDQAAIDRERHDSCYWLEDGRPGMPAVAFKAAMVNGCRFFEGVTMTLAKTLFYVEGEGLDMLVPIEGTAIPRQDTPRNADGTADLRYRFMFDPWSAQIRIHFYPAVISPESVLALLDAGGKGGIGDWRPSSPKSSTGTYGQFRVLT